MANNQKIILHLNRDWYYLQSEEFRRVGNRRTFRAGDILYNSRDSEFFLVVPKKKLKAINWAHAGKEIYERTRYTRAGNIHRISKRKILFSFRINEEEEVQTCVKPESFPIIEGQTPRPIPPRRPHYHYRYLNVPTATESPKLDAERRAQALFYDFVRTHAQFSVVKNELKIWSKNGHIYKMNLNTGFVYDANEKYICVWISDRQRLPRYDKIIAKAITIAYAPELISTLS